MSSLGEIQQIYSMLQEIDSLLAKIGTVAEKAEEQIQKLMPQALYLQQILNRTITLMWCCHFMFGYLEC